MPCPRAAAFATLSLVVGALHWALLAGTAPRSAATQWAPALQVRSIPPPREPARPSIVAVPRAPAPQRTIAAVAPSPRASPLRAAPLAPPARRADDEVEVPVYPTRLPPATTVAYTIKRGALTGDGVLHWQPSGSGAYEARLEGRIGGTTVFDWTSRGAVDAAGVAPERFVMRRGRQAQAANFQRTAAKITFSGPTVEFPLLAGAQDRLSWMVQLPAIVAATPERFAAGAHITVFVAGARGDADVWTFDVQGLETVITPDGDVHALPLLREPVRPYDSRVEVWLDPARHHLPVRARIGVAGRGDATELVLGKSPAS